MEIKFESIGVIHTPFETLEGMPIQPSGAVDTMGTIVLDEAYTEGLSDLDGFSHIILLYHFHKSKGYKLKVKPFLDNTPRGLFSTRAPRRPNAIGLSVVRLINVEENRLTVQGADMLNQTPVIDIKPFVSGFDAQDDIRTGWLEKAQKNAVTMKSDQRFIEKG